MAKKKTPPIDGLGPDNLKRIHKAVRQVWQWSYAWRLVKKRATDEEGFYFCEKCFKTVSKVFVDHINPVGEVGGKDYIKKMFCSSSELQALCKKCHDPKTKRERQSKRK